MGSTEEPDRKRRHLNKDHLASPPVDAQMLQFQNHKLAQQLYVQRNEINVLEGKLNQLLSNQASFDDNLSKVSRVWNQVVDDLESLTVRYSSSSNGTYLLEPASNDRNNSSVSSEQTFLQRFLDNGATGSSTTNGSNDFVKSGLCSQQTSTAEILKLLVQSIDYEQVRNEELLSTFLNGIASNGLAVNLLPLVKEDEELYAETKKLRSLVDGFHLKHRELSAELGTCHDFQAKDRAELKRLKDELEEACADLEGVRHQLAALRSENVILSGPPTPSATLTSNKFEFGDGGASQEKVSKECCQLEADLEEVKTLAARRLMELQEALQNHLDVIKKFQHMQNELDDQERIVSSRQYQSLTEQVQHLRSEVERYRAMVDQLQGEHVSLLRREKEIALKTEAGDAAQKASTTSDDRAAALELKLRQCMSDCDSLRLRVEGATHASGRKESVADLEKVITSLHKDMSMMQAQLFEYKEAGSAVFSLRAELHSLRAIIDRKTVETRLLSDQYARKVSEINSLQNEFRVLRGSEKELKLIFDMYNKESNDSSEMRKLQQEECRAQAEMGRLQLALDEHNLELRVKNANEAEAACQQKLAAVEAEIAELRQSLQASYRVSLDLKESLQAKKEEGDPYISEIEAILHAYEDVQTQNQRLLQEIKERDEYNSQLMSESLKARQLQFPLQAEKQVLDADMQHANSDADLHKQRITYLEEQASTFIAHLEKATDENRQQSSAMESAKRKAVEAEKQLSSVKLALDAAHKLLEERGQNFLNVNLQLEKERFNKRRAREELEVLNMKITRLQTPHDSGPTVDRLREEIRNYEAILKCSVCQDRSKEVVITKCYHLFCSPCIQRNLELRHRKCPGCGIPFGQNDVRVVYI
uniref:E3 ubiquitin protein ligase n=1 Tax=Physcomitrium patens TaxID=3218 RepID=A0A7I4DYI2_PHYPA